MVVDDIMIWCTVEDEFGGAVCHCDHWLLAVAPHLLKNVSKDLAGEQNCVGAQCQDMAREHDMRHRALPVTATWKYTYKSYCLGH